jgi:serine/threonine protein kinase
MVLYELIVMKQPYFDKNHFEISTCNVKGERPMPTPCCFPLTDRLSSSVRRLLCVVAPGIRPTVPDSVDKEAFKELLKLFNKCTNKKPQDRPSTADILATLAAM